MGLQQGKRGSMSQCERGPKLQVEHGAVRRGKGGVLILEESGFSEGMGASWGCVEQD